MRAALVPELYVTDLDSSLRFYTALGFTVRYQRREERFAYIEREGAELMLEEPRGRTWLIGPLEHPFGRGINLQITVSEADELFTTRLSDMQVILPPETRQYSRLQDEVLVRQFVLADPDGYLIRFSQTCDVIPGLLPTTP